LLLCPPQDFFLKWQLAFARFFAPCCGEGWYYFFFSLAPPLFPVFPSNSSKTQELISPPKFFRCMAVRDLGGTPPSFSSGIFLLLLSAFAPPCDSFLGPQPCQPNGFSLTLTSLQLLPFGVVLTLDFPTPLFFSFGSLPPGVQTCFLPKRMVGPHPHPQFIFRAVPAWYFSRPCRCLP